MNKYQLSQISILGSLAALTPFAVDMYLPSLGDIALALHSDISVIQLTISVFLFILGFGQLFFGPVTDYCGRKPVAISALILFIAASLLAALAGSIEVLMSARVLQALAGSAIGVCVMASVRDHFSGNDLAKAGSYMMMMVIIAPMIAPLIGGQILLYLSWPWIFVVLALLACINLVAYLCWVDESLHDDHKQSLQLKPVLKNYWMILSDRASLSYILISGLSSTSMFVFITSSSFVYIDYFQVSKQHFGWLFGANVALMMVVSFLNTRLLNHFSWYQILRVGIFLRFIPVIGLIAVALTPGPQQFELLVIMVILNIGLMPLVGTNAQTGLMHKYQKNAGSAAALVGSFRFVAGGSAGFILSLFHATDHMVMVWGMCIAVLLMFIGYLLLLTCEKE